MNYQKAGGFGETQTTKKSSKATTAAIGGAEESHNKRAYNYNYKKRRSIKTLWNDHIMERFIRANLFTICCVAAALLLVVYLGAFSCEVSWILEAHGDLPFSAYILCTLYFVIFVGTAILIHGLVTGLPWGLFAWSVVIGLLSIPELILVMLMTTQHWGLQSTHGVTELTAYLVRLIINCFALICVIPTGLRWRRESQVRSQLQGLASRMQFQTPAPSLPYLSKADSRRSSGRMCGLENIGYQICEDNKLPLGVGNPTQPLDYHAVAGVNCKTNPIYGSQNEFNASIFSSATVVDGNGGIYLSPGEQQRQHQQPHQHQGQQAQRSNSIRAQSLMDLRCTLPGMYNPRHVLETTDDKNAKYFNITVDDLKKSMHDSRKPSPPSAIGSAVSDPIYCSIDQHALVPVSNGDQHKPQQQQHKHYHQQQHHQMQHCHQQPSGGGKLARNCISLENLDGINRLQNEMLAYGNSLLLHNCTQQQQYYLAMLGYANPLHHNINIYRRPSVSSAAGFVNPILPPQPLPMARPSYDPQVHYYGGFGYANYTNPYVTANSKLSLGNESDDYRRYRDVAL